MILYTPGPGVTTMLPVLFLLVLLALSSASLQDTVKNSSQHANVSSQFLLSSAILRQKRQAQPPNLHYESPSLKWLSWTGTLPKGSVSISNEYVGRVDYVCKYKCNAGFYNPAQGSYCYYPYEKKELKSDEFEILVNKDKFEILEWKDVYYDSVPQNSVKTCSKEGIYVGKNDYGLGKVHVNLGTFFLPWKGSEYYYYSYQVLTYDINVYSEHMSNIRYKNNESEIIPYPPETMRISAVTNNECKEVSKTVSFSIINQLQKTWNIGSPIRAGIKKTFTGGVPGVVSGSIEISGQISFQFSMGETKTEETSHSISVDLIVPPNHYCRAYIMGYKYKANIPFTAHVSRTYSNGETTRTLISGTYDSVQIGEVHAVVDRCKPVSDAKPCQ